VNFASWQCVLPFRLHIILFLARGFYYDIQYTRLMWPNKLSHLPERKVFSKGLILDHKHSEKCDEDILNLTYVNRPKMTSQEWQRCWSACMKLEYKQFESYHTRSTGASNIYSLKHHSYFPIFRLLTHSDHCISNFCFKYGRSFRFRFNSLSLKSFSITKRLWRKFFFSGKEELD
jgi:hypothetical protein